MRNERGASDLDYFLPKALRRKSLGGIATEAVRKIGLSLVPYKAQTPTATALRPNINTIISPVVETTGPATSKVKDVAELIDERIYQGFIDYLRETGDNVQTIE